MEDRLVVVVVSWVDMENQWKDEVPVSRPVQPKMWTLGLSPGKLLVTETFASVKTSVSHHKTSQLIRTGRAIQGS